MGQVLGLDKIIIFSAIASFIFGGGFFINEASAGVGPLCFGLDQDAWELLGFNVIIGTNKADRIDGTNGNDVIISLGGNDRINAKKGDDKVCSGDGKDNVHSGPGDDMVDPGAGRDTVNLGPGMDQVFARDGERDTIDCGKKQGPDFAEVDAQERRIKNCEVVAFPYGAESGEGDDNGDDDNGDDKKDKRDKIKKSISNFFKRHR